MDPKILIAIVAVIVVIAVVAAILITQRRKLALRER